jgi:hypothetical protein
MTLPPFGFLRYNHPSTVTITLGQYTARVPEPECCSVWTSTPLPVTTLLRPGLLHRGTHLQTH